MDESQGLLGGLSQFPGFEESLERVVVAESQNPSGMAEFFRVKANDKRFANFVFQGGGVLGVAHLGFLYALEQVNVRAVGIAGTSAGAIVSILAAASRSDVEAPVAEGLIPILWRMPAKSFIDGPYRVRRLVKFALRRRTVASLEMLIPLIASWRRILRTYGLNSGNAFYDWLADSLGRDLRVRSMVDLEERLQALARSIKTIWPDMKEAIPPSALLKVIATGLPQAAVPTSIGMKFMFPGHLRLFSPRYEHQSPALLARASMSVPLFFEPASLELESTAWTEYVTETFQSELAEDAIKDMAAATSIAFIDGGLLSNFPIDAFLHGKDCQILRKFPTIGAALAGQLAERSRAPPGSMAATMSHLASVVDAMRHARDREAKELAELIGRSSGQVRAVLIDTGRHNWLNFQLDESEMTDLFVRGIDAAARFLETL